MLIKIRLSYEQIKGKGKHKIILNETQKKKIDESITLKKGFELELSYEQTRINHLGRHFPLIFEGIGALGALLGGGGGGAPIENCYCHKT